MKIKQVICFFAVLFFYSMLYLATSKQPICEGDCELVRDLTVKITANHSSVIDYVSRCSINRVSDSVCVYVKDIAGVNWAMIADSTCYFANQVGLPPQKVFVIKEGIPNDTLARLNCP
jgi:hypothetical protein